jgi:Phasin protein
MADIFGKSLNWPGSTFTPGAFGEMGKKQAEMQKEFLDTLEEINRSWLARAQSGVTLASELVAKLAAARSLPEATSAYQECMTRQMELLAEDGRRIVADSERLMRAGARLFSNGSPGLTT